MCVCAFFSWISVENVTSRMLNIPITLSWLYKHKKIMRKLNLEGFLGTIHLFESEHFRRMQVVC